MTAVHSIQPKVPKAVLAESNFYVYVNEKGEDMMTGYQPKNSLYLEWLAYGYEDGIEAIKSNYETSPHMEIIYESEAVYGDVGDKLRIFIEHLPNIVVRLRKLIISETLKPFNVRAAILDDAICDGVKTSLFPNMTSLTMNGEMDEKCFVKFPKLTHLTINWPQYEQFFDFWSYAQAVSTLNVPTLQVANAALNGGDLIQLLAIENVKELWINYKDEAHGKAILSFMNSKRINFERVKVLLPKDELRIVEKNEYVSHTENQTIVSDNDINISAISTHNMSLDEFSRLLDDEEESIKTITTEAGKKVRLLPSKQWTRIEDGAETSVDGTNRTFVMFEVC